MGTWDPILAVWRIYLAACLCGLDWDSECSCTASDLARDELRSVLGEDWHEICRRAYVR